MGQHSVWTMTLVGVQTVDVQVEVDVGAGLPTFAIVGLPDLAVQEAKERVRSALRASGYEVPNARIVVNLAPGPVRKHGTGFDLPIALGILVATRQLPESVTRDAVAVGELSLDGSVRPVGGMLAFALGTRALGKRLLCAPDAEALSLAELDTRPVRALSQLRVGAPARAALRPANRSRGTGSVVDFAEVVGHELAKRGLLVAAAGGHNVLMVGPPGAGKTMLARRLPTILPPLDAGERLETALVQSVAGIDTAPTLGGVRPFRAPHHSASIAGLVGGGSPPRPGEASLAHNGVLFLDEMAEFGPAALQALRQPLEDGSITLVRAEGRLRFPARFALAGAANPCPCGYFGDSARRCGCSPGVVERYQARIGGPLMDRIDVVLDVSRVDPGLLLGSPSGPASAELRDRVMEAGVRAASRGSGPQALLAGAPLLRACGMSAGSRERLEQLARGQHLSGRAVTRLLRVARTIADLEGCDSVDAEHLSEAVAYRAREGR